MPAGARLKYRSNIAKYAEFVFEGVDPTFSRRSLENKAKGVHNVIVGGLSYGQGSSREHAAICPSYLGVRAVITKSFERIHSANLINFGIVPFLFANEADYDKIAQGDQVEIPNVREAIRKGTEAQGAQRHEGVRLRGHPLPDRAADRHHPGRRAPRVHEGEGVVLTDVIRVRLRRLGGRGSVRGSPCDEPARLRFTSLRPPSCGDSAGQ